MTLENPVRARDDRSPAHVASGVTVSRRNFLMNTTVSVASLASAAAIAAPTISPADGDAELLQLGLALDRLGEEWLAQIILDRKYMDGTLIDPDPDGEGWSDFHDRLFSLVKKILGLKATTLAGLAVQTSAIALADDEEVNIDDDDRQAWRLRQFLDSICSVLGFVSAPMRLRLGLPPAVLAVVNQSGAVPAAHSGASDPATAALLAMEERIMANVRDLEVLGPAFTRVEEAMFAWQGKNPKPDGGQRALAAWERQRSAAKVECGYDEAKDAWNKRVDQLSRMTDELADIVATTHEGLGAKVRLAAYQTKIVDIDFEGIVSDSIIRDLANMKRLAA